MSYTALYRKFRPQEFEDVKGQEHIVTTLKNQIKADRIGQFQTGPTFVVLHFIFYRYTLFNCHLLHLLLIQQSMHSLITQNMR